MFTCEKCNTYLCFKERYDTYACDRCNEWKDKVCENEECFYCKDRPEKPNKLKEGCADQARPNLILHLAHEKSIQSSISLYKPRIAEPFPCPIQQ